jgi:hypothetical protein
MWSGEGVVLEILTSPKVLIGPGRGLIVAFSKLVKIPSIGEKVGKERLDVVS